MASLVPPEAVASDIITPSTSTLLTTTRYFLAVGYWQIPLVLSPLSIRPRVKIIIVSIPIAHSHSPPASIPFHGGSE